MNTATFAGTIGKDAEIRPGQGERPASFSLSVSNGKDKEGNWKDSTWVSCSLWGERGQKLLRSLTKGTKLTVTGKVTARAYEKDGKPVGVLELRVSELTFMGGGERSESSGSSSGGGQRRQNSYGPQGTAGRDEADEFGHGNEDGGGLPF